jgi:hypothetical protein
MTILALLISIIVGTASLSWGFAQAGVSWLVQWIILLGVVWIIATWRRWRWFAHLGLALFFVAAALGLWFLDFSPGWMFGGVICGLIAWDLTDFRYRQRFAATEEERRLVETRHLLRVSIVALLGFAVASLAMAAKLQFNFEWAGLLTIVIALGLSQIIRWFRRRS